MLQCFCKNQKGVRQRRKSFVTDPKITGEECTFAITNRQLPLHDSKTSKRAQMTLSELPLAALTALLTSDSEHVLTASNSVRNDYKLGDSGWACQLTTQANEIWYFRSIASKHCDLKAISSTASSESSESDSWSANPHLSEQAQDWMTERLNAFGYRDTNVRIFVINNKRHGAVLAVLCNGHHLVASALQTWGNPPDSVVRDWQKQRINFPQSVRDCSTAETLVTVNGTLIPMIHLIDLLADASESINTASARGPRSISFENSAPNWPVGIADLARNDPLGPHSPEMASLSIFDAALKIPVGVKTISQRKKKSSYWNRAGIAAAGIGGLVAAIWLLNPKGEPVTSASKHPSQAKQVIDAQVSIAKPRGDDSGNAVTAPDDSEIALTLDPIPTLSDPAFAQPELTLESLLADLRPNTTKPIRLDALSASSIIAEVLSPAGTDASSSMPFPANEDSGESAETPVETDIKAIVIEGGVITLERPLKLRTAVSKETIAVGKFVLAKACRCDITFKVASELVVEPIESVTIEGVGRARWKIAIEDEEPELLVEIASRPGARWQVVASVGLRESRNASPILIGPRQAQNVGNRLVEYRQWIRASIEALRSARSNNRLRPNFDFTGEIKKLERQDSETEKAIDRLKVIERLSHYFFDSNDVHLQLTAVEKP